MLFYIKCNVCILHFIEIPPRANTRTELASHHYSELCEQLVPVKTEWPDIARALKFKPYEIDEIQSKPLRLISGDHIYDVIEFWLRWAPGDRRGSTDVATLEVLQAALNKTNNATIKLKLNA